MLPAAPSAIMVDGWQCNAFLHLGQTRTQGYNSSHALSANFNITSAHLWLSGTWIGAINVGSQRVNALHCEVAADTAGRPCAAGKVGGVHCIAIGILQRQGLAGVV